jgi:hypothetical protein
MVEYDGAFITDGSDGGFQYTTVDTNISVDDTWSTQGIVTMPSGKFHSRVASLPVAPNLT